MSHFTVLVIGDNPEEQLAPFQENNMDDCPKEYLEFYETELGYQEEWDLNELKIRKHYPNKKIDITEDQLEQLCVKGTINMEKEFESWNKVNENDICELNCNQIVSFGVVKGILFDEESKLQNFVIIQMENKEKTIQEQYGTFENFVSEYHGLSERDSEYNRYGYWENTRAKWDWYELGGRWSGFFRLKNGSHGSLGRPGVFDNIPEHGTVDQAYKKDINFDLMRTENFERASEKWEKWEELNNSNTEDAKNKAYWSFGIINIGDKDNFIPEDKISYLKRQSNINTFAILKDGEWYEKGEMGWFGMYNDEMSEDEWGEKFDELLVNLTGDTLLSVYDCHI